MLRFALRIFSPLCSLGCAVFAGFGQVNHGLLPHICHARQATDGVLQTGPQRLHRVAGPGRIRVPHAVADGAAHGLPEPPRAVACGFRSIVITHALRSVPTRVRLGLLRPHGRLVATRRFSISFVVLAPSLGFSSRRTTFRGAKPIIGLWEGDIGREPNELLGAYGSSRAQGTSDVLALSASQRRTVSLRFRAPLVRTPSAT